MPRTTKSKSLSAFAEKFTPAGSGSHPAWDAVLAPLTPRQRLAVAMALVEDVESIVLERSRKSMANGNPRHSRALDSLADELRQAAESIGMCEGELTGGN